MATLQYCLQNTQEPHVLCQIYARFLKTHFLTYGEVVCSVCSSILAFKAAVLGLHLD